MGLLSANVSRFRNDLRIFKVPPYLALLCILGGIVWICLLPFDEYSRRTYVSENALLPGQVHTYFTGSEQNVFRAYRHEVADVLEPSEQKDANGQPTGMWLIATDTHRGNRIEDIFRDAGIKTARQMYTYESAGKNYTGENIYGIVHGPRADGTESVVLVAPIRNIENQLNVNGVTLLLTLARYFSRWSLWSKDIILLVTPDAAVGTQAWVDAYHSMHDPVHVADLTLKSGHIQGAVCIDYPFSHRFETLHVSYDGINGQLPNLDLINTLIAIASGQMGIGTTIQHQHEFTAPADQGKYFVRLRTLLRGMKNQALGHATGPHSVFMPYHIDAITLTAIGEGWQDEMAFGRTVESMTRSLNNLLEKLHQSFFFYLLLQNTRFVSIGTYLPSAMAIGASFTIVAMFAWVQGGYQDVPQSPTAHTNGSSDKHQLVAPTIPKSPTSSTIEPNASTKSSFLWKSIDRPLTLPVAYLASIQLLSLLPIYFLTHLRASVLGWVFIQASALTIGAPFALAYTLSLTPQPTPARKISVPSAALKSQFFHLLSSLSLLILGLNLTVLATLNFSLSMFLGIVCAPIAFVGYSSTNKTASKLTRASSAIAIFLFSPPVLISSFAALDTFYLKSTLAHSGEGWYATLKIYLENEVFAFNIWRAWGVMIGVWAIWVPAWIACAMGVVAGLIVGGVDTASASSSGLTKGESDRQSRSTQGVAVKR